MSSGSKIGLLLALAILGTVGAYYAFGPGATGGPPLQVNISDAEGAVSAPDDVSVFRPAGGGADANEGVLSESVENHLARGEDRNPVIIIDQPPSTDAESAGESSGFGETDPLAIPEDPLKDVASDGGKGDEGTPTGAGDPATPPAAPPAEAESVPTTPTYTDYVVKHGDNYWSIAASWFGDGAKHDLIRKTNPMVDPTRLQIGQTLRLPSKDSAADSDGFPAPPKPEPRAAEQYTVMPGDTLLSIARSHLGDEARWKALYEANRREIGDDPNNLKAGILLTLPE